MSGPPPPFGYMPRPGMPPMPGPGMPGMPPPGMMPYPGAGGPRGYGGPPPGMYPGPRPSSAMRPQFLSTMARPPPVLPKPMAPAMVKSTTVMVGKIAPSVEDEFIEQLLVACGQMRSWRRGLDPESQQKKGFGFCEFEEAEGVMRAQRLLNNLSLDGQALLLKPSTATEKYVREYQAQKEHEKRQKAAAKKEADKEQGELEGEETEEQGDNRVLEKIMALVSDREESLSKMKNEKGEKSDKERASELLQSLEKDESMKKDLPLPPPPARDREVYKGERGEREREREREREHHRGESERERVLEREYERERQRERKEEDAKKRESDRAYEKLARDWERTEREMQKSREREKDKAKAAEREHHKAVKEDLEVPDTDDELEHWCRKPYRNSRRSEERRKRRLREQQEDDLDREKEAEELAEEDRVRREVAAERGEAGDTMEVDGKGGYANGGAHELEVKEEQPTVKAQPDFDPNDPIYQAMIAAAKATPPIKHSPPPSSEPSPAHEPTTTQPPTTASQPSQPHQAPQPYTTLPETSSTSASGATAQQRSSPLIGIGFGNIANAAKKKSNLQALFGEEEEEGAKRRKLVPLQYTEEELRSVQQPATQADAKELLRKMMDSIPTNRTGVFSYAIKWAAYDADVIAPRVQRWVEKKIQDMLGMPMPDVVTFIMEMLGKRDTPQHAFSELEPILDNEAETFVIKLYRMVIYETEKSALGM